MSEPDRPVHSPLGASSASRWMACPGSVALSAGCPNTSSFAADEGTAAHFLGAHCLQSITQRDAWEDAGAFIAVPDEGEPFFVGDMTYEPKEGTVRIFEVDEEMVLHVQFYLDYVRTRVAEVQGELIVEQGFDMSELHPDFYGTGDAVIVSDTLIEVVDFKYGVGISVSAVNNPQIRYYLAGVLDEVTSNDGQVLRTTIVQPRGFHHLGPIRSEDLTFDELLAWLHEELIPAAERTEEPDAPLVIGEHCRFCPAGAALKCPKLNNLPEEIMADVPEDAKVLESWEISEHLEKCNAVRILEKNLNAVAYARAMGGETVPGLKLIRKRSDRTWKQGAVEKLEAEYGEKAYSRKLLTPPAVEKLPGGKSMVTQLAHKPDAGLTLVLESKEGAAVKPPTAAEVFADVEPD